MAAKERAKTKHPIAMRKAGYPAYWLGLRDLTEVVIGAEEMK